MKNILKRLKKVDGQSLAEFAVTTAMMATLATTAAPKFSGVGEGAKEKKTMADIDKIMKAANNFYNDQVTKSGRGRFPGQSKYNLPVPDASEDGVTGGYTWANGADGSDATGQQSDAETEVDADLDPKTGTFASYKGSDAVNFCSVFGTNNPDLKELEDDVDLNPAEDIVLPHLGEENHVFDEFVGAEEFLEAFGGDPIKSPFQDGHYIYTVIAGGGTGTASKAPILFVADLESPRSFNKKLQP